MCLRRQLSVDLLFKEISVFSKSQFNLVQKSRGFIASFLKVQISNSKYFVLEWAENHEKTIVDLFQRFYLKLLSWLLW